MNLVSLAENLARVEREIVQAYYRNMAGLTRELPISSIIGKYKHFFSQAVIAQLCKYSPKNSLEKRSHCVLLGVTCAYNIESETSAISEELANKEAKTPVEFEDRKVPFRYASVMLANEAKRERRLAISQGLDKVRKRDLNPLRLKILDLYVSRPVRFGFKSYLELCETAQMRNLRTFADDMAKFLTSTDALYESYLKRYMQEEVGIDLAEALHSDLLYLRHARRFDHLFPKEKLLSVVMTTLRGLGFDIEAMPNVKIDAEEREGKTTRPFVAVINPPDEVRLVTTPIEGHNGYANLLHEAGRAVHLANMDRKLPTEFRYWGDRSTTEGLAYLLRNLVLNRSWLARFIGGNKLEDYLRYAVFQNLLSSRQMVASFLYELRVFEKKPLSGISDEYVRIMNNVMKVRFSGEGYLEITPGFISAAYLCAKVFEAQFRRTLIQKYGDDWWTKKEVGDMLHELFRQGRVRRPEEILKQFGYEELDIKIFVEQLAEVLGRA